MQPPKLSIISFIAFTTFLCAESSDSPSLFRTLTSQASGVDFTNPIEESHPLDHMYVSGFASGSVTVADFNGDSRPDLFFTGCSVPNALYLQDGTNGALHFSKTPCGVESPQSWAAGAAAIDIDQDGDLDLYVANYDKANELFINHGKKNGNLHFTEEAKAYGLDTVSASLIPSFTDYDKDGDLDLFLLTNQYILETTISDAPTKNVDGKLAIDEAFQRYLEVIQWPKNRKSVEPAGTADLLFRNNGKNANGQITFENVTQQAGLHGRTFGLSSLWFDYNNDGYPDIYVANDYDRPDQLWHNNGDGTFREVHKDVFPYTAWASMGLAQADFDNNGYIDIVVPDMGGSTHFKSKTTMGYLTEDRRHVMVNVRPHQTMRNCLLLNSGLGKFTEAAYMAGIATTDWTWSAKAGDFDNDGKVDLFFTNGVTRNLAESDNPMPKEDYGKISLWDHYKKSPPAKDHNRAFRNLGDHTFENYSQQWKLDHHGISYAAAMADLDLDGDLDLITCNLDEEVHILQNQQTQNHGLTLKLKGPKSNPHGIGATASVESKLGTQIRLLQPSAGYMSFDSHLLHFGLGPNKLADKVTVHWPDGTQQVVTELKSGTLHTIEKKPQAEATQQASPAPLFTQSTAGPKFLHKENSFDDYDDFQRQPLLPIRLSRGGPGMAWADIDNDGDEDVYFSGARYQAGEVHLNLGDGRFNTISGPWEKDADCEDMGAVWLDADADGDLDLFVCSGTPETFSGSSTLRDRLYLNQGNSSFQKAGDTAIPKFQQASQCVALADYDRDGDLDLFIGSRSSLGRYPMTPKSRLLRNDSQPGAVQFTDVTDEHSFSLRYPGMITSATWSDLDNNGWPDLILAVDYGPIRIFFNHEGKLQESDSETGLANKLGWWNSVTTADVNGDGKFDIIAGNTGLNTKYGKLKKGKTIHIHYGDMDDSGVAHIIESKQTPSEKAVIPVRGKG